MGKQALLVIDVQNGMFREPDPIANGSDLLENLQFLIEKARELRVPVIYVQHNDEEFITGTPDWEIQPSVLPIEGEPVIQKETPDSFYKTALQDTLQNMDVRELIICGNKTEYCIDTTVRRAFSLGYKVSLVGDAHGTSQSPTLNAKDIINHHNYVLREFANVKGVEDVLFNTDK